MGNCLKKPKVIELPKIYTADISKVKRHTYAGNYKYCTFNHIYDGDTADIYFYHENRIIRNSFRFYGFDSAEMKPLLKEPNRELIIIKAKEDKEYLKHLLNDKYLVVYLMKNEKYGRLMGNVWRVNDILIPEDKLETHPELIDENKIDTLMINSNHGKPYFGGKKE